MYKFTMLNMFLRCILLLSMSVCALGLKAQTIESVMRAIQERHLAVEQRNFVLHKLDRYSYVHQKLSLNYVKYDVSPIVWEAGLDDYPEDGALDGVNLEELLKLLRQMRTEYNNLTENFILLTYSPQISEGESLVNMARIDSARWDIPRIEPINEHNLSMSLRLMASGLNRMTHMEWPIAVQKSYTKSKENFEHSSPVGFGSLENKIDDEDRYWVSTWEKPSTKYFNSTSGRYPFLLDEYSFINGFRPYELRVNYTFDKYRLFEEEDGKLVRLYNENQERFYSNIRNGNLGILFFTGKEMTEASAFQGKYTMYGRQWPVSKKVKIHMNLDKGTWPGQYQEFKGYKKVTEFSSDTEIVRYNVVDGENIVSPDRNFSTGAATGTLVGEWINNRKTYPSALYEEVEWIENDPEDDDDDEKITHHKLFYEDETEHESWSLITPGSNITDYSEVEELKISPGIDSQTEKWHYDEVLETERRDATYVDSSQINQFDASVKNHLLLPYHATSGLVVYEPSFIHFPEVGSYNPISTTSAEVAMPVADFRRQLVYIPIGPGLDGVGEGYIGFGPLTEKDKYFDGFGDVIDLELLTGRGNFEIYYDYVCKEEDVSQIMSDEYIIETVIDVINSHSERYNETYEYSIHDDYLNFIENRHLDVSQYSIDRISYAGWGYVRTGFKFVDEVYFYPDLEKYVFPHISQIVGRDVIIDVVTTGKDQKTIDNGYNLNFYHISQKGDFKSGKYELNGKPFNIISIRDKGEGESSSISISDLNKNILVEYEASIKDKTLYWDYFYRDDPIPFPFLETQNWWSLDKGERFVEYEFDRFTKITTSDLNDSRVKMVEEFNEDDGTYSRFINGLSSGSDPLNDLVEVEKLKYLGNFYVDTMNPINSIPMPEIEVHANGETRLHSFSSSSPYLPLSVTGPDAFSQSWDTNGRLFTHSDYIHGLEHITSVTTVGNIVKTEVKQKAPSPGGGTETVVNRSWRVYDKGFRKVTSAVATNTLATTYDDPSNLVTITEYYGGDHVVLPWAVKKISYPDGTKTEFEYSYDDGELTTVATSGNQVITTVINNSGYLVDRTVEEDEELIAEETVETHDIWGRPLKTSYHDNTYQEVVYETYPIGRLKSFVSRDNKETFYSYDGLERVKSKKEKVYNTLGNVEEIKVDYIYDGFKITESYSDKYRIETVTNAFGDFVSSLNTFEPKTKVEKFDDFHYSTFNFETKATTVERRHSDGSLAQLAGNSVEAMTISYGVVDSPIPQHSGKLTYIKESLDKSLGNIFKTTYYDAAGRVVLIESPSADPAVQVAKTVFIYNNKGQLEKTIDPDNFEEVYGYSPVNGRMVSFKNGNKTVTNDISYNDGKKISVVNVNDVEVHRRVSSLTGDSVIIMTPFGNHNLNYGVSRVLNDKKISIFSPWGVTEYKFSNSWIPSSSKVKSGDGTVIQEDFVTYDEFFRLSETNGKVRGKDVSSEFLKNGLLDKMTVFGDVVDYTYSDNYKSLEIQSPLGEEIIKVDAKGNLKYLKRAGMPDIELDTAVQPDGVSLEMDAAGGKTTWEVGRAGEAKNKDYQHGIGYRNEYTVGGRLKSSKSARNIEVHFERDANGYVDEIKYSDKTPDVSLTRNHPLGFIDTLKDASGNRQFTYDGATVTNIDWVSGSMGGFEIIKEYDDFDRVSATILTRNGAELHEISYGYDLNNHGLETIQFGDHIVTYALYGDTKLLDTTTFNNGTTNSLIVKKEWDNKLRLDKLTSTPEISSSFVSDLVYLDGQIQKVKTQSGGEWNYQYVNGQLDIASFTSPPGSGLGGDLHFDYDFSANGNRTRKQLNQNPTLVYQYLANALNQLESINVPGGVMVRGTVDENSTVRILSANKKDRVAYDGVWALTTSTLGYEGEGYRTDGGVDKGKKWVDFKLTLAPGTYRLEMKWPGDPLHASNVPVIVSTGSNRRLHTVNQKINGGSWNLLQTLNLTSATEIWIRIGTAGTDGIVVADALRFVDTAIENPLPTVILDTDTANAYRVTSPSVSNTSYEAVITVDNTQAMLLDVLIVGTKPSLTPGEPDAIAEEWREVFIPKADEKLAFNPDGMLESNGRWTFEWDGVGNLIEMDTKDEAVLLGFPDLRLLFEYDSMSRRFKKTVYLNGRRSYTRYFVYDGWDMIAELDGKRKLLKSYVWGPDVSGGNAAGGVGGLLAVIDHDSNKTYYAVSNFRGDVVGLVDAQTGTTEATYDYGPFGELLKVKGPARKVNPFMFSSKYADPETGFYYYGYRYYNPETGTWLKREPLGEFEAPNMYVFCNNDPINGIDVLGLFDVENVMEIFWEEYGDRGHELLKRHILYSQNSGFDFGIEERKFIFFFNNVDINGGVIRLDNSLSDKAAARKLNAVLEKNYGKKFGEVLVDVNSVTMASFRHGAELDAQGLFYGTEFSDGYFSSEYDLANAKLSNFGSETQTYIEDEIKFAIITAGVLKSANLALDSFRASRHARKLRAAQRAPNNRLVLGMGAAGKDEFVKKVVNSNMGHAADRAVERAGYATVKEAREALQQFGKKIADDGILPRGTIVDPAHADRVLVPGFGDGGAVVYQVKDGKLTLKTVLNWIEPDL